MRLLNVATYKLEEFLEHDVPEYAILSHRWTDDEVSHRDVQRLRTAKKQAGWSKIAYSCVQAQKDSLSYVWVDTCCIDKASSAELQEVSGRA